MSIWRGENGGPVSATVRLWFVVWILVIFVGLLASAAAWSEPRHGGTLRLATEYPVYGFDGVRSTPFTAATEAAGHLVMERLFDMGESGEIISLLGLSMTPSDDGKSWTIALRRGVAFHDGTPFNADAVVLHWSRVLNPDATFRGREMLREIESVEKTDEFTVRFRLKHPWKPFASILAMRRSRIAWIPSPKAVTDGVQNRAPVGTGPFVLKKWKRNDHIALTRNMNYWREGKPHLDEIVIRVIPDGDTRYASLVSNQVDMILTDRPNHIKKLMADPRFIATVGEGAGAGSLLLNTRKPPLDDPRVRRALAHAWDQEKFTTMIWGDTVPLTTHWFGNSLACGDDAYRRPDVEKARALIREYGKPVEIEYIHSATPRGRECGAVVQQLFKRIGVTVKAAPLDWAAIYKKVFTRDFNLASWGVLGIEDMGVVTRLVFHSKGPYNLSGFSNPVVDELLHKQNTSLDQDVRDRALCEVVRHVNDSVPMLFFAGRRYHLFSIPGVKGVPKPYNQNIRLENAWLEP